MCAASANEVDRDVRTYLVDLPGPSSCSSTRRSIVQTYEDTDTAVKVVYGVNELSLDLGGKSIRGIWKML